MEAYIAVLRGINVGGQKKIRMVDLKACLTELGYSNVQTYIQSGNVIFRHENAATGFHVPAIVMTSSGLESVISGNPFRDNPEKDPDRLYVTFLSAPPTPANIEKLVSIDRGPEEFFLDGRTIYLFLPHGYGKAKMNNGFLEYKIKLTATTRNWKTVNKLAELANASES